MFKEKVLKIVEGIPKGKTLSYKEVAKRAGSPNAYRVVGSILKNNQDLSVPCHRVIKSDKTLGEYNGLRGKAKERLLEEEGVLKKI